MNCTYKYPKNFVRNFRNMVVIFPLCGLAMFSCRSDRERLIRAQVDLRVSEYANKERAKCRMERLSRAAFMADSILLDEASRAANNPMNDNQPLRPVAPPPIDLLDSGPVSPIFIPDN